MKPWVTAEATEPAQATEAAETAESTETPEHTETAGLEETAVPTEDAGLSKDIQAIDQSNLVDEQIASTRRQVEEGNNVQVQQTAATSWQLWILLIFTGSPGVTGKQDWKNLDASILNGST